MAAYLLKNQAGLKYRFIDGAALFNAYKDSASSDLNHFIAPLVKQPNPCVIIMDEFTSVAERYNQECNGDKIPAMALWLLLDKCLNHSKIICY